MPEDVDGALPRRIEQQLVAAHRRPGDVLGIKIGSAKFNIGDSVAGRIITRPGQQFFIRLDAGDSRGPPGHGQGEVADAAEEIEHLIGRGQFQQIERLGHGAPVHGGVHLHEVRRPEFQDGAVVQPVLQGRRLGRFHGHGRIHPLRLAPQLHPMALGEGPQPVEVRRRERRQVAQHQRHRLIAAGHLHLRDAIRAGQRGQQLAQRRQQRADALIEDQAGIEAGQKMAARLAEADQHPALGGHQTGAESRAPAISPNRAGQWRQPALWLDLADVRQQFGEALLLGGDLRGRGLVLQQASTADAKMRTWRRHPVRAGGEHFDGIGAVELHPLLAVADAHFLAGQRAIDKRHLAVDARNSASLVVERLHLRQGLQQ